MLVFNSNKKLLIGGIMSIRGMVKNPKKRKILTQNGPEKGAGPN
jgi:hypothetical protein